MSYLTEAEIEELQTSKLKKDTPFAIGGVRHSQLSIARHYGGCTFRGANYIYYPERKELIRVDVINWVVKRRPSGTKCSGVE